MLNIAVDAMGGDYAPQNVVKGACLAAQNYQIKITLVGQEDKIQKELNFCPDYPKDKIHIFHTPEVVGMSESPSISFKKKKNSSIVQGLKLVKEKEVDGFLSAGNTGAVMLSSSLILGRISGVERAAISAVLPSRKGPVVMLDMGSVVDCKSSYLAQFALMGKAFSNIILGVNTPRVGLLNIGEEEDKGNALSLATYPLIQALNLNFIGNIEGKDILKGDVDVVVCDGFIGNCLLKFGEDVSSLFMDFFKSEAKRSLLSLVGLLFLKPGLKRFKSRFDYDEYGGAPLLGINGVSVIAHGNASPRAIKNAIRITQQAISGNMVSRISEALIV